MKRSFDIAISLLLLIILVIPILLIAVLVKLTSKGPVIHWSDRVGRGNILFKMPKFRTMRIDTPVVAIHLLSNPDDYLTPIGRCLRKSGLDELPQLISILRGDMSIVGPRPALYNQDDLIALRTQVGVHAITPGLTGWAQINGRAELPIHVKAEYDAYYLKHRSILFDLKILLITLLRLVLQSDQRLPQARRAPPGPSSGTASPR